MTEGSCLGGSSMASSVRQKVAVWMPTLRRLPTSCAASEQGQARLWCNAMHVHVGVKPPPRAYA